MAYDTQTLLAEDPKKLTIQERMLQLLCRECIWLYDAEAILEEFKQTEDAANIHWHDKAEGYPHSTLVVLFYTIMQTAQKWLQEHHPDSAAISALANKFSKE